MIEGDKEELKNTFSPYMYFYEDEVVQEKFRPTKIEDMLDNSSLYKLYPYGIRKLLLDSPSAEDIKNYKNWAGIIYYLDLLSDGTGNYVDTMPLLETEKNKLYARVTCDEYGGKIYVVVQYWFFYLYNDFTWDNHEGDWEMIEVLIDFDDYEQHGISVIPVGAAYSRQIVESIENGTIFSKKVTIQKSMWQEVHMQLTLRKEFIVFLI
ncbi:MAG: hypothetical protein ACE5KE_13100 [Methanosarcinales archaeon]